MTPAQTPEYLWWAIHERRIRVAEVAASLRISYDKTRQLMMRLDVPLASKFNKVDVDYDALIAAYNGNDTLLDIAKDFGLTQPSLSKHIRRLSDKGRLVMRSKIKKVGPRRSRAAPAKPDPHDITNETYNSAMQMGSELLLKRQMAAGIYWRSRRD